MAQVAGAWEVTLSGCTHRIEFEHGTTSGRRVVRVDGKEVLKRDWQFKLVGHESFRIGLHSCSVLIRPARGLSFEYALMVDGRQFSKFREQRSRVLKAWTLDVGGVPTRVILEKDTLDVWVNGEKIETTGEFVEEGSETHFKFGGRSACVHATSSGDRRTGLLLTLTLDGELIASDNEL